MGWDDAPPTTAELKSAPSQPSWDQAPPTKDELILATDFKNQPQSSSPSLLKSLGGAALGAVGKVGEKLDSYTGAPMRAGISAAQSGNNPLSAAWKQFGEDASTAPTGKDIVKKAGITDDTHHLSDVVPGYGQPGQSHWFQPEKGGMLDPTPQSAAGHAMELAANPLNFVGAGAGSKLAGVAEDAPSALKAAASGPKAVYDPFLKASRIPGKSVDELSALGADVSASAPPSFTQKLAQSIDANVDKGKGLKDQAVNIASQVAPAAARLTALAHGNVPGYFLLNELNSPEGRYIMKGAANAGKSMLSDPRKTGLILNAARDAEKN